MSYPFGGHPRLKEYLRWAEEQGCEVKYGVQPADDDLPMEVIVINNPKTNKWVVSAGLALSDVLVPTTVARFDRRLGLSSPFAKLDDLYDED